MFRALPLPIIRCSFTVHLALVYVIWFEDSFRAGPAGLARKLSSNLYYKEFVTMHGHMNVKAGLKIV